MQTDLKKTGGEHVWSIIKPYPKGTDVRNNVEELARVMYWKYALEMASASRQSLVNSYSDYYKHTGNSPASKAGQVQVKKINGILRMLVHTPLGGGFKHDLDTYFKGYNVGSYLLTW